MLNKSQFNILKTILENDEKTLSQRQISDITGYSLGKVNMILKDFKVKGVITDDMAVTEKGLELLKPYKVTNAIIMAAGLSSRFAPLSIEKPKALLKVKGEILIEREIEQLKAAGIERIIMVVGYMKEKLYYLADKYDIEIVVNEEYAKYNNPSTLMCVINELDNSYICSSDNYFTENVFEPYVYKAYYSGEYTTEYTDEYCMYENKNGRIKDITIGGVNTWFMTGHAYFDKNFSKVFREILKKDYDVQGVKENLWESILKNHIKELDIDLRKYESGIIYEFDSLEELRNFDSNYINNVNSSILTNICKVLDCKAEDIVNIKPINTGLTNTSFSFYVGDKGYVYRHPGPGTENYINRKSEAASMEVAFRLGLDDTYIYMDSEAGWKISQFIEDAVTMDYHDMKQVETALTMVRKLHGSGVDTGYGFDIFGEIDGFYEKLEKQGMEENTELTQMVEDVHSLRDMVEGDNIPKCICHSDCYNPNFLIDKKGKMYLIDWEYSGMADPASDLGTFIACSDYKLEEAKDIIGIYLGHEPDDLEYRHYVAYIAILSFYWYIWSIYQDSVGKPVGEWQYLWYRSFRDYLKVTLKLYDTKEDVR